jgi:hypothetical protein
MFAIWFRSFLKQSSYASQTHRLGINDLPDKEAFGGMVLTIKVPESAFDSSRRVEVKGHCQVFFDVYIPPVAIKEEKPNHAASLLVALTSLIVVVVLSFCCYDRFVQKRNSMVVDAANRSTAIVDSLFPANVRDRILEDRAVTKVRKRSSALKGYLFGDNKAMIEAKDEEGGGYKTKPIADLFPETTILVSMAIVFGNVEVVNGFSYLSCECLQFGDIVGFTAWSSVREPSQVFELLETVYHAFDEIAERRRIFKVETIGMALNRPNFRSARHLLI